VAQAYRFGAGGHEYRDVSSLGDSGAISSGGFAHHLQTVTSPMGETTHYIRGDSGQVERVVYPDGGEKVITYGADALPETVTSPQATVLTYQHHQAKREVSRTSSLRGDPKLPLRARQPRRVDDREHRHHQPTTTAPAGAAPA
jgi:uncharacterized protein RhaS with RHS repeats